jgi:nucleotide-binding universal stress UspA family protein
MAAQCHHPFEGMNMRILIPVDDSETSLRAIDWLARLPEFAAAEVGLVNVRGLAESYGAVAALDYEAVERSLREGQQNVLAKALEHARRAGLKRVTIHTAHGLPAEVIVASAKAIGADQIVMASHGRGAVGTFFMGSVAQEVVHLAPMAVTLVK